LQQLRFFQQLCSTLLAMHNKYRLITCTLLTAIIAFCTTALSIAQTAGISSLKLLGKYDVPHNFPFQGTTVGGLSGIDYDAKNKCYYLISDDRSAINPARFYTAKIAVTPKGIDSVAFQQVMLLKQKNGTPYPNSKQDPAHTPDPEAIRYNPLTRQIAWSSEGERAVNKKTTVLEDPAVTIANTEGLYIDTFPLPEQLHMHAEEEGPRQNGVFEGLTFADNYKTLYVNVEEPLYQDGPRAGLKDTATWIRILKYDVAAKKLQAEYAYHIEPVAYAPLAAGAFMINGVPDILYAGDNKLLVMERSFSTGRMACTIRLFITDVSKAANIAAVSSLKQSPPVKPLPKRLLLNMDALGIYVDNVEGMTFGPTLPNGHKTLVMVADNNFSILEKTQFFLFEVIP
jgi:hypothetical protein